MKSGLWAQVKRGRELGQPPHGSEMPAEMPLRTMSGPGKGEGGLDTLELLT